MTTIVFHGSQAEILKLQAFQLLLRHQVHSLGKLWNLPDTFEVSIKVINHSDSIYHVTYHGRPADHGICM